MMGPYIRGNWGNIKEDANLRYVGHNFICNSTLIQEVRSDNLPSDSIRDALPLVDVDAQTLPEHKVHCCRMGEVNGCLQY